MLDECPSNESNNKHGLHKRDCISQGSPKDTEPTYTHTHTHTHTHVCAERERDFKDVTHMIVGAGKSKICSAS